MYNVVLVGLMFCIGLVCCNCCRVLIIFWGFWVNFIVLVLVWYFCCCDRVIWIIVVVRGVKMIKRIELMMVKMLLVFFLWLLCWLLVLNYIKLLVKLINKEIVVVRVKVIVCK